jgi:hypothetical protein
VKQSGEFAGREYLELKALRDEKAHKLSLSNPTLRNDVGFHDMVVLPLRTLCASSSSSRHTASIFLKTMRVPSYDAPSHRRRYARSWVQTASELSKENQKSSS